MDQADKLQTQLVNLSKAQLALLAQHPPDLDGYEQLADTVSRLQYQLLSLSSSPVLAPLDPADEQTMKAAVDQLTQAINSSQGATEILSAAAALAHS